MINNICGNKISGNTNAALKATASTLGIVEESRNHENVTMNAALSTNNNNDVNRKGGGMQTTYGNGIWYSEIIDSGNNVNNKAIGHKHQYCNNDGGNNNNNSNANENVVNKNVWLSMSSGDIKKEKQQQFPTAPTNNESDIIIVDIENDEDDDDDNNEHVARQLHYNYNRHQHTYNTDPKFFTNANVKRPQTHTTICGSERVAIKNDISCGINNKTPYKAYDGPVNTFDIVAGGNGVQDHEEDEADSLDSMETLSDNVSIWIDGEKHWVAGVDANTTCSELIWALLHYQNVEETKQRQHQQHHQQAFAANIPSTINEENIATSLLNKINSNQRQEEQQQQQQQIPKVYDKNTLEFNLRMCENEGNISNTCATNKPNIQNTAKTNNNANESNNTTNVIGAINTCINQSMPTSTKENYKIIQNSSLTVPTSAPAPAPVPAPSASASASSPDTPIKSSLSNTTEVTPPQTLLPLTLPPGIATVAQLATEYVIVKQYHHCEEYLDGSAKVFDVLPPRNGSNKKECELLLRHLGPAPTMYNNNTTPQLSSLISTDKDSGMGSPVGSARSAKFRRRKHKSSQWLAQANTLHPKLSRCSANERLMKIILAQDETIQRQLSLLREKERQITKIEEEKHRKRERELGKNYLLETYLNGLDEADCEPEVQNSEEIFIDEPFQRATATSISARSLKVAITPSVVKLAAGAVTDNIPSAIEALNGMPDHKLKEREVKKEKKKKRHKEKQTKDEEVRVKDFHSKTNKNKDKEKVDRQQQQHHELKIIDDISIQDNDNQQEVEMQILWLEKIYSLNKQLQREEELAAKLHAKIRKQQLRKAQQTQQEAQMEIDKLDNNLAHQCGDIRKIEANLLETNEQLQKKLLLLERLSVQYLEEQQENKAHTKDDIKTNAIAQAIQPHATKGPENALKIDKNTLLTNLEKSLDLQKLSLNNIKSKEEVIKLERIIAKPSNDLKSVNSTGLEKRKTNFNIVTQNNTDNPIEINTPAIATNQRLLNVTSISAKSYAMSTLTDNQEQQQEQSNHHHLRHEVTIAPSAVISVTGRNSTSDEIRTNDTQLTTCMSIDKNMLSSLHVQNAKTIKKQMFHTQTATAAKTASAVAAAPTAAAMPFNTMTSAQPATTSSEFSKRQFQQTMQQHMPMPSSFLTSRPQNLHQIQATNIVIVQQPTALSTSSNTQSSATVSSPLMAVPATATATAIATAKATSTESVLLVQRPPISTSPSPSIMAMNTVDISHLGTLV